MTMKSQITFEASIKHEWFKDTDLWTCNIEVFTIINEFKRLEPIKIIKITCVSMTILAIADWTTLVLSKQSTQLMRNTPFWSHIIPLLSTLQGRNNKIKSSIRHGYKHWPIYKTLMSYVVAILDAILIYQKCSTTPFWHH